MIEVLNKIDLLEPEVRAGLLAANSRVGAVAVSAVTGEGLDHLLNTFEAAVTRDNIRFRLTLPHADGEGLAWAYRHAQVLGRADKAKGVELTLAVDPQSIDRFQHRFTGQQFVKTAG
jgi:GTPase